MSAPVGEDGRALADGAKDRRRLEDFWTIVWQRKWIVGLAVLATLAAVYIGNSLATPAYEASATLHIKEQMPSVLGESLYSTGFSDLSPLEEINTQMEILKSRSMLEEVIAKLGLVDALAPVNKGLSQSERLQSTIDILKKRISVGNVTSTRLIRVSVRSRDPEQAMRIANAISEAFIERNVESKRSEANAVLAFVSDQVNQVSAKLDRAEEDLLKYKQAQRITDLPEEARLKLDRLAELESSYQQANIERQILATRNAGAQKLSPTDDLLAGISNNPSVKAMQDQLTGLEGRLTELGPEDPKAAGLKGRIESLRKDIQTEIEKALAPGKGTSVNSVLQLQLAEYKSQDIILAAQQEALRKLIDANEGEINRLSAQDISLARLERARRINDELYSALMKAKNEAQIEAISQIGNIDVIDPAVTPLSPVSPRKQENFIVGFLLSLLMGVCLTFLLDYFDNTVKTEEEIKKLLEIPLLGFIPRFHQNGSLSGGRKSRETSRNLSLFTRDAPKSSISEAFRLLRTNLSFIELDRGLKTIAVTSAVPGEGKTTIVANLAVALAAQEERVLVMDADFRAPAVHKMFGFPHAPGFTNILTDRLSPQSLIRRVSGVPNLSIITSGPIPPNPAEIIGSSRMKELIDELREGFDRVIFDAPPVLGATDAVVLASRVDGTLLVLRTGRIDRRAITRMREILGNTRTNILGGILNGVDVGDKRYSYYGYY